MENPLIGLFGRSSASADLEEAVRRRIIGPAPGPESPGAALPPPEDPPPIPTDVKREDESPALLLRNLAGALERNGVEIATVTAGNDGFLVHGALEGAAFRQWYSVHEVRELAAEHAAHGAGPST